MGRGSTSPTTGKERPCRLYFVPRCRSTDTVCTPTLDKACNEDDLSAVFYLNSCGDFTTVFEACDVSAGEQCTIDPANTNPVCRHPCFPLHSAVACSADLRSRVAHLEGRTELDAHDMLRAHVLARIIFDAWRAAGMTLEGWREIQPTLHEEVALLVEEAYHETNRWLLERKVMADVDMRPYIRRTVEGGGGGGSGLGDGNVTMHAPLRGGAAAPGRPGATVRGGMADRSGGPPTDTGALHGGQVNSVVRGQLSDQRGDVRRVVTVTCRRAGRRCAGSGGGGGFGRKDGLHHG